MRLKKLFVFAMLSLIFMGTAFAADDAATTASADMPAVKSVSDNERDSAKQLDLMGDEDFFLITDPNGTINYVMDPETNEISNIVARKGVVLSNMNLALNCDQLDYDNAKTELVATGRRVLLRQGDLIASCQLLTYNVTTQDCSLKGKPTVYMRTEKGVVTQTGNEIVIRKVNGKPTVTVYGNAQVFNSQGKAKGASVTNYQKTPNLGIPAPDSNTAASGSSTPIVQEKQDDKGVEGLGKLMGISPN